MAQLKRCGRIHLDAAVYARKSTDQAAIATEQKSVTRQVEHARAYAEARGWHVDEAHVFVDDGISGAEFAARPGFLRLMNALTPRPPFQVLIMSEESRLGREAIETAYALKQIITAGVRVFFYLEDRERTFDSPTDKILMSLTAYADELEREKARQRTYDALQRKARAGYVTGGRTFGYANAVIAGAGGRRSHVERRIREDEAAIVRRIFELCAEGHGLTHIARRLNDAGAIAPRAQSGRPCGWSRSTVRDVLYRELYRGVVVWNRSRKRDRWGRKRQHDRAPEDWIRIDAPDARIVSETVWHAAHERLAAARGRALRQQNGRPLGRPPATGVKHLLAGLLTCACCGSSLEARSRQHGTHRRVFYGCAGYSRKGTAVCRNRLVVPLDIADETVLATFEDVFLDADVVRKATDRALALLSSERQHGRLAAARRELAEVKAELERLASAIAKGGDLDVLVTALRARQDRRERLEAELASATQGLDRRALRAEINRRLTDWRRLLRAQPAQGQQILRHLIVGRLTMTPLEDASGYRFNGVGTFHKLLGGLMYHEKWRPHRGSPLSGIEVSGLIPRAA